MTQGDGSASLPADRDNTYTRVSPGQIVTRPPASSAGEVSTGGLGSLPSFSMQGPLRAST